MNGDQTAKTTIFEVNNCLVTRSGACLKGVKVIRESIPLHWPLNWKLKLIALASAFRRRKIRYELSKPGLVVHNIWSTNGYYHWVAESLVKLWEIREKRSEVVLILPGQSKILKVMQSSSKMLGFEDMLVSPPHVSFYLKKVYVAHNSLEYGQFRRNTIVELREKLVPLCSSGKSYKSTGLIYVSRINAMYRKVSNEEEVVRFLDSRGFEVISWEDFNFEEQVGIMARARCLVSIHGAGLVNLMFMRAGSHVLELYKESNPARDRHRLSARGRPSPVYENLARVCGVTHQRLICAASPPDIGIARSNITVDCRDLKKLVDQTLSEISQ